MSKLWQFGDLFLGAKAVTKSTFYVRIYQLNFTLISEGIMDRNTGIIITIVTAILCGCPGLFSCFWGLLASVISFIPGADIDIGGSSEPVAALLSGLGAVCVGVIFVAIPIAVWFFTVRNKPASS
jgi:hypothetical protein